MYKFRAISCSSSVGQMVLIQHLVSSLTMIYLLTAIGLSPGGSAHLHTNNIWNNINNNRTTQITINMEECGPCPVLACFTLAFALQLRKKHGKTSVRLIKTSVRLRSISVGVQYTYYMTLLTVTIPDAVLIQFDLLRMSKILLETCTCIGL